VAVMVSFLGVLFEPGDTITLRPIETWTEDKRKGTRVDYKGIVCLKITDDVKTSQLLHNICDSRMRRSIQERTNTFFGVCPRFDERGKYEKAWQIRTVRALWADIDHATVEDVVTRIVAVGLPRPSLIISSGNGVHVYWLLAEPY